MYLARRGRAPRRRSFVSEPSRGCKKKSISALHDPQAELHVFQIREEIIPKVSHGAKRRRRNEQTAPGEEGGLEQLPLRGIEVHLIRALVAPDRTQAVEAAAAEPDLLRRIVSQDLGPNRTDPLTPRCLNKFPYARSFKHGVVVEHEDVVRAAVERLLHAAVVAAGIAEVLAGLQKGYRGIARVQARAAAVGRPVVHEEDRERGIILTLERVQ